MFQLVYYRGLVKTGIISKKFTYIWAMVIAHPQIIHVRHYGPHVYINTVHLYVKFYFVLKCHSKVDKMCSIEK